jgi:hypothetical protein
VRAKHLYLRGFVISKGKDRSKGHTMTRHSKHRVEQRYNSTLSLTSALDGASGQRDGLSVFPSGAHDLISSVNITREISK